jgi:hypothetical protein
MTGEITEIPLGKLIEELVETKALEVVRQYDATRNREIPRDYNPRLVQFLNRIDPDRTQEIYREIERRELT